jgi:E3 ubiquitin-protein ligase BRE1
MEKSFSSFDQSHPDAVNHVKAEAEVRQQLASVTAQLEKYQTIYGNSSTLPLDQQELEAQLRLQSDEIHKFKLLDTQHRQVSTSVEGEVLLLTE